MARYNQAIWRGPVPNKSPGRMGEVIGLVVHIEQGPESSANNWFHNPGSQVSAHFGNPKKGPLDQWVDTDDEAWAEMAGNFNWISCEHEGYSGQKLNANQLNNLAHLYAWLHEVYDIPLQLSNSPYTGGIGFHAMGGMAWGGHLACPGAPIIAQRALVLELAARILNPTQPPPPIKEVDMIEYVGGDGAIYVLQNDGTLRHVDPTEWRAAQTLLKLGYGKFNPSIPASVLQSLPGHFVFPA